MLKRQWERALVLVMVALTAFFLVSTAAAITRVASTQSDQAPVNAATISSDIYPIVFPVDGEHSYTDSWGAPRSGGRTHQGTDIFAAKGTPVLAAADGTIVQITIGQRAGRYIEIEHAGGWHTLYLHLNNDTAGTDDGAINSPATAIQVGQQVSAGEPIDHVGDSGNAEETPPHLHFEIHDANGVPVNPYLSLRAAEGRPVPAVGTLAAAPSYTANDVAFIGNFQTPLGFNADVTVHGGVAYMGTWGRPEACPESGVRMIDVSDPHNPEALSTIADGDQFPATSTDSVWVGPVDNENFTGDLAVVSVRLCDTTEPNRRSASHRGLALFEVTDPTAPKLVGIYDSGEQTQGVHEVDVVSRPEGRVLVAATVLQSWRHTAGETGDVRIIEISNPAQPIEIADWDLRRDGPAEGVATMMEQVHDELELHAHSVTWGNRGYELWVANWDAGVVLLDMANPARPSMVTMYGFDPESDGNAHSIAIDEEAGVLVRTDQDLINAEIERHGIGWGDVHIYDISQRDALAELSTYYTKRAEPDDSGAAKHTDGRYSAHVAQIVDGMAYVAWYSDGVRVLDLTDPAEPKEVAWFVPPIRNDPQEYWDAPDGGSVFAMVWGVHVEGDLVFISDMNTGLWIAQYPIEEPPRDAEGRRGGGVDRQVLQPAHSSITRREMTLTA